MVWVWHWVVRVGMIAAVLGNTGDNVEPDGLIRGPSDSSRVVGLDGLVVRRETIDGLLERRMGLRREVALDVIVVYLIWNCL